MMKIVIVEDEQPAANFLIKELRQYDEPIEVLAVLGSVKEGVAYFKEAPAIDLVLMDINLSDGQSFDIFQYCTIEPPVVFITTYEQFTMEAFRHNGIEYLMKPLQTDHLFAALRKYRQLKKSLNTDILNVVKEAGIVRNKKNFLIARKGIDFCILKTEEIAYFFSDNYIVFAIDAENKKFIVEGMNLSELMEQLEPTMFYRVNRKYIVNINYVRKYKILDRVKLQFELVVPVAEDIVMGQENARQFRKWLKGL